MLSFQFFPKNIQAPDHILRIVEVFKTHSHEIDSNLHTHASNEVLKILEKSLVQEGCQVEAGKTAGEKITIPVLHGLNNKIEKSFDADAYNPQSRTVLEVEAGRAVTNYQFLKDIFQASMMMNTDHLVIAVRNLYNGKNDFNTVVRFMDTLYASGRLKLPFAGTTIIGY